MGGEARIKGTLLATKDHTILGDRTGPLFDILQTD